MRPLYSPSILSLLFGVFASAQTFPNPQPCLGVCDYIHDPTVIIRESDGLYFRFATFENIQIATAPSLQGPWTPQGPVLPNGSKVPVAGAHANSIWAPDVHKIGDTYYLYYSVSVLGTQESGIGVATSTTLESGSWVDHGPLGIPYSTNYNRIDANLFSEDGKSFLLSFGSYWEGIYQVRMSDPLTIAPGATPQNLAFNPAGINALEGPYEFWWLVNGVKHYYMFLSKGICCNKPPTLPPPGDEYQITVCRSTSPTGPFIDKTGLDCLNGGGTLLLGSHGNIYAPGGQGVMYDPKLNSIVMYYHYIDPAIGFHDKDFLFGYNLLTIGDDGWPFVSA